MSELPRNEEGYTDKIIGFVQRDTTPSDEEERVDAEQDFKMDIYRKLPDLIAEVVREVRSNHPSITNELVIAKLVKDAISVVQGRTQEITLNSRPS